MSFAMLLLSVLGYVYQPKDPVVELFQLRLLHTVDLYCLLLTFNFMRFVFLIFNIAVISMIHKVITSKSNEIELRLRIADEQSLKAFLNEKFQIINRNIIDDDKSFNPLSMLKLNLKLAAEHFDYTLFGLPITSIYGYANDNDGAMYLTLNISDQQLVKLVDEWDEPLMFVGDYHKMDNTVWKKGNLTISMIPNPVADSNIGRIIIITNMGMKRITKNSL